MKKNPAAILVITREGIDETENNSCNQNEPLKYLKCRFDPFFY